jgi:hypothetical protein
LAGLRQLNEYNPSNRSLARRITFTPAPPDRVAGTDSGGVDWPAAAAEIRKIVPLQGGRFLILWLLSQESPGSRRNFQFVCLHDSSGQAVTSPAPLSRADGAPFFADDKGHAFLLRNPRPNRFELAKVSVETR